MAPKTIIAVSPELLDSLPRTLSALAKTYPVEFSCSIGRPPDAEILLTNRESYARVAASHNRQWPCILLVDDNADTPPTVANPLAVANPLPVAAPNPHSASLSIGDHDAVDSSIRSADFETTTQLSTVDLRSHLPAENWSYLGTQEDSVLWAQSRNELLHHVDVAAGRWKDIPKTSDMVRSLLSSESRWPGLALIHFVHQVLKKTGWHLPPIRACLLFDDPNLRWKTYGWVDFNQLEHFCRKQSVHISFAMIPLDTWSVDPSAAQLFRESAHLSLVMHGNNHSYCELGLEVGEDKSVQGMSEALRRMDAFEAKSGVQVDRVMAPPHGVCSQLTCQTLYRLGFLALTANRPRPWLRGAEEKHPETGLGPMEIEAESVPVLTRLPFGVPESDLKIRALLRQPLIVYGHHGDLKNGLGILEQTIEQISSLGKVEWTRLSTMAKRSRVVDPSLAGADLVEMLGPLTAPVETSIDYSSVAAPSWKAWPRIRRMLTEARDRMVPLTTQSTNQKSRG